MHTTSRTPPTAFLRCLAASQVGVPVLYPASAQGGPLQTPNSGVPAPAGRGEQATALTPPVHQAACHAAERPRHTLTRRRRRVLYCTQALAQRRGKLGRSSLAASDSPVTVGGRTGGGRWRCAGQPWMQTR
jgi:hypothetical protein